MDIDGCKLGSYISTEDINGKFRSVCENPIVCKRGHHPMENFLEELRELSRKGSRCEMTLKEIKSGESKNIEFKVQLPDDSKNMKIIVAYANTSGGKIIIG